MYRWWALAAVVGLCACTPVPPQPVEGVRDMSAPIAATTRFDAARLAGDWVVRHSAVSPNLGTLSLAPTTSGFEMTDGAGRVTQISQTQGARWRDAKGTETWLLWVDADYRTAALGNPDGTLGMILDRNQTGGGDRIKAAREVMVWFGYPQEALQ